MRTPRDLLFYKGKGTGFDAELTWLGWQWMRGPSRLVSRLWNALPIILLALILWRIW